MSKYVIQASWDDCPHLSEEVKKELLATIPEFQRRARSRGIPELGKGAIYTVPQEDFTVPDFPIPKHWKRAYGMDVGWNYTAVVWGVINPDTDVMYLYACFKRGHAEPAVHVDGIKARGKWIPGVCDPAARASSQVDGRRLLDIYRGLGLNLALAINAVESGIMSVYERLTTGRLKVFASMAEWFAEYALYRRDEGGTIHKEDDHLMDATRYLVVSGISRAALTPLDENTNTLEEYTYRMPHSGADAALGWMN